MSDLPRVGILAEPGSPPGFVALVRCLSAWCRPQATGPAAVAWLASSPAVAAGVAEPVAVWVEDQASCEEAAALSPAVIVTANPQLDGAVLSPYPGLDLRAYVPMAPVIRRRWRSRLGLPPTLVVTVSGEGAPPDDLVPTAMALASVVTATGLRLAEALAWAAPCVTDAASAAALGATKTEVVIGPPSAAAEIAGDEHRAAALSTAGRRLAERRLDQHGAARHVAEALGLVATTPAVRVLDDLRTPAASTLRRRVDTLVGL
jgi:hypothetical protein